MKVIPLSEGTFTVDKTKQFVPFDTGKDDLQQRSVGSLLVEIQPFVVVTSEDVLLLDTGLGFTNADGKLQIHQNLIDNGINPGEVTKVLLSHLHKDHIGGIAYGEERKLAFPQAAYYVQQDELNYAFEKGFPSYITEELECLKTAPQVKLLHGNGVIDGYIKHEVTGAHSKFHQVFWIVDSGETVFFGGDDAPQLQQMRSRFIAKYDYDGKKCMELRQQWWEAGEKDRWKFLFYHDVKNPVWEF